MIAGNADVPSPLSAQREKPLVILAMRMICIQREADETSAFPAFTDLTDSKSIFLAKARTDDPRNHAKWNESLVRGSFYRKEQPKIRL